MSKMPSKPSTQGKKPSNVAEFLDNQIYICGKAQADIAREAGFTNPNVITMFKQGKSKVPLHRAPALARSIGLDSKFFLLRCLEEYEPELHKEILSLMEQPPITENEMEMIELLRANSKVANPKINTSAEHDAFVSFASSLKGDNLARS